MRHLLSTLCLTLACNMWAASNVSADWNLQCEEKRCQLFSEIKDDDGTVLARVYLEDLALERPDKNVVAIASLPLGVYIPSGVAVDVDKDMAFRAQLLECREDDGCRAAFSLKPDILEALKGGKTMSVAIVDARTRRAVGFHFSLKGFTAAYQQFESRI